MHLENKKCETGGDHIIRKDKVNLETGTSLAEKTGRARSAKQSSVGVCATITAESDRI